MKYILIMFILFIIYLVGRTHTYIDIIKCSDRTAKIANKKAVFDYYGRAVYTLSEHRAFIYMRTLECILGEI